VPYDQTRDPLQTFRGRRNRGQREYPNETSPAGGRVVRWNRPAPCGVRLPASAALVLTEEADQEPDPARRQRLVEEAMACWQQQCERAMNMAHKLSIQLRAAEDRNRDLQAERDQFQDHAERAEEWLRRVYHEIEEKLIRSRQ
jgi:hypothetical protein